MAKEIKFNIKLNIDGKEQLVSATSTVENLRNVVDATRTDIQKMNTVFMHFNQYVAKIQNINDAAQQLASTLNSVTEESRTFGAAMNVANTMAGKSGDDFAKLKGQVTELSKALPIAREELANGLYQVISNGVPENNWIDYLQKSAKASIGGVADLGETIKVTSTIIKNYGLSWDAAESVQDKIQLTAKNGVTSFEQLAQALPRVTGNAATLGVSIDELMATFATLTGVSGNTNEVATQMAAVFTALVKPSSEAAKMAQQMGIEFNAASIKAAGGLQNFLTQLDKSVKTYAQANGMLEQEVYAKLFGSAESLRAIGPLTGQLADTFAKNVGNMKGSAGTIDDAFGKVANSGAAAFQMLKNQMSGMADTITKVVSPALPILNFASQAGNSLVSILALNRALQVFCGINAIAKTRIIATNAAALVWNATSVRVNAIVKLMSASFRGAAVSATTLKLAIQGLLVSTGVGIAIVALTEIMSRLSASNNEAANSASRMSNAEQAAANNVKQTYDSTLKQTYSDLMAKYEQLKSRWLSLKTTHEKTAWLKNNKTAFEELGLKISGLSDAENIFTKDTSKVAEAFERRAKAAAYAAQLVELYKQQLELKTRKDNVDRTILAATNEYNHSQTTSNKDNPYAEESNRRAANIAGIAADMKQGGDGNIDKINDQLEATNAKIKETKAAIQSLGGGTTIAADGSTSVVQSSVPTSTKSNSGRQENSERKALVGSIDWYEDQIRELQNQLNATADESTAKGLQASIEAKQKELKDFKVRIGVEKADESEVKTAMQALQDQLHDAQREFEEATTIEAKVKADAKINDIQTQIDQTTKGKVSITADVEPSYIEQGSTADKRQSYANAQSKVSRIQQDYEIGIIDKDEAWRQITEINAELSKLGLKPINVTLDVSAFDKAFEKIQNGWGNIQNIGSGIQGITNALEGNGNAWEKASAIIQGFISIAQGIEGIVKLFDFLSIATAAHTAATTTHATATAADTTATAANTGVTAANIAVTTADTAATAINTGVAVANTTATTTDTAATTANTGVTAANTAVAAVNTAAKSGEAIASATASGAKMPFPFNLVAIAAGVAAVMAAIAAISGFATGGIVGGTSTSGDKKFARVNSGEMILNKTQQARLFQMINTPRYNVPSVFERKEHPRVTPAQIAPTQMNNLCLEVVVRGKTRGTSIEQTLSNVRKIAKKSGRRSNLV